MLKELAGPRGRSNRRGGRGSCSDVGQRCANDVEARSCSGPGIPRRPHGMWLKGKVDLVLRWPAASVGLAGTKDCLPSVVVAALSAPGSVASRGCYESSFDGRGRGIFLGVDRK